MRSEPAARCRRLPSAAVALALLALPAAGALAGATPASAATLTESFDQTYALTAGGALDVVNSNGAITVEVWDRPQVRVEAVKTAKAATEERAHELMRSLRIDVTPSAGRLRVETHTPQSEGFFSWLFGGFGGSADVEYHLHVPRQVVLLAETTNGSVEVAGTEGQARLRSTNGSLRATGTHGNLDLETTNGRIEVRQAVGGVRGETTNGRVEVELTRVEDRIALESTNGSLTVRVPSTLRATLDAGTTNGHVRSDLPVAGSSGTSRHHLRGTINGGGPEMRLSTTNGSIQIYAL
jgi:hypothetical protein